MRRYLLAGLIALAVVLTAGGSFVAGRATAGSDATVTAAAKDKQCQLQDADQPYLVRYVVKGIERGICVDLGSDCAIAAHVGDPFPKACGGG